MCNLINQLNKSGLTWFIDSGSLLGLVREGAFLENDTDIDIGILCHDNNDEQRIESFMRMTADGGYRLVAFAFNGHVYKYKFLPNKKNGEFNLKLDFQIYRTNNGNESWICPQLVFKTNLSRNKRLSVARIQCMKGNTLKHGKGLKGFMKKAILGVWTALLRKKYRSIELEKAVIDLCDVYMWKIPKEFTSNISALPSGYNAFTDNERYLTYRYGNWHIPQKKWNFTKDDMGLYKCTPEELQNLYV